MLIQLKRRNRIEILPYEGLYLAQARLQEENDALATENSALTASNRDLKAETAELSAVLAARAGTAVDSVTVQELQQKMFNLQEELTELHRRKGDNAQQVIDLSAALKLAEMSVVDKSSRVEALEAEIVVLKQDLKARDAANLELEATNQLLKDEYQALQLALTTAETKLNSVKRENDTLITQLMALKAKDAERMNLENDLFLLQKERKVQIELAEAASEFKNVQEPGKENMPQVCCSGVSVPTKSAFKFEAHEGEVMCVSWDYSGRYFATASTDRKIKVWEMTTGGRQVECRANLVGSNAAVMSVHFDNNCSMVLGASNDFATRIWTIDDCRLRHTLTGHSGKVMSAKFFCDASRVVSGSHDRTLKIWDLRSKACVSTMFAGSSCNDVVNTDQSVISGHFDKKVRCWDVRSSKEPSREVVLGGKVTSLDLSKDMNYLAICSRDDRISVLDLRTNSVLCSMSADGFHVGCDWSRVTFSPDGEFVAAGSGDGTVYVWSVSTRSLHSTLHAANCHAAAVYAVSWHPGGANILSVDKAKTCVVWSDY